MAVAVLRVLFDNPLTGWVSTSLERGKPGALAGSVHQFAFDGLNGGRIALADFAGRPLLLVNTASRCGFTPQYAGLEALHRRYPGLALLGIPSNDFGGQEPGSAAEIATFCETRFAVGFPLTAKTVVSGASAHPLFRWLAAGRPGLRPRWNFHKYLFDGTGRLITAASSLTPPEAPRLVKAIEALL